MVNLLSGFAFFGYIYYNLAKVMNNNADEKIIKKRNAVSLSSLMVDFPADKFRGYDEIPDVPQLVPDATLIDYDAPVSDAAPTDHGSPQPDVTPISHETPRSGDKPKADEAPAPEAAREIKAPWYCVLPVLLFGATAAISSESFAPLRFSLGMLFATLSVFTLLICSVSKRVSLRKGPFNIAFICCAAALVISYISSPYQSIALYGAKGSMEGTIYLLAYVLVMFCAVNVMRGKAALIAAAWTAAAVFAARGVFSVLGYFGKEIGRTDIIMITGGACLVFMLFAGQLRKKGVNGPVSSFILWLFIAVFIAAAARVDLISFAAALCATIIILAAVHFKMLRAFAKPALLTVLAAALVLIYGWNYWMPEIEAQKMDDVSRVTIKEITTEDESATIVFEDCALVIKTQADEKGLFTKAEFFTESGDPLSLSEDKNAAKMFIINEEPYHSFVRLCIIRTNTDLLRIEISGVNWDLRSDGSRLYYINSLGEADQPGSDISLAPATGCRYLRERQAVRIFAQDLTERYSQYGCGADCFSTVYSADHVYRYNCGLNASAKTDDMKSLYLLAGLETGYVTLCTFAAVFIIYAVLYILRLRGEKKFADGRPERAAILAAAVCLALIGITNSPKAGTLPLFFMLIGTGIAAEYKR